MVIRRVLLWMPVVAAWVLLASTGRAQTPEDLFKRGNAAYEQGRYEQSAEAYRGLLRYEIRDPIVEYNLGNAEFRLGHLGQAILHYERARRLAPVDADVQANLEFARSLCFDRVEAPRQAAVLRWLREAQNRLGPDRQAWIALAATWLLAGLVAWCFSRPDGWRAAHGWTLAVLLLVLLVSVSSWYATLERLEVRRNAVVLDEVVEVLAGPGYKNPALFTVHEGLTLEIRAEREEWLQVSLPNGLNGWIAKESLGEV
jgi:tetratricopeptide (TPR) repeat protein